MSVPISTQRSVPLLSVVLLSVLICGPISGCREVDTESARLPCLPLSVGVPAPTVLWVDDFLLPDSVRYSYRNDAARLALRWIYRARTADTGSVELPGTLVQSIYAAFIHIHRSDHLPARDSVVSMFKIHTFPFPELHRLIVGVDTTRRWVNAWRQGRRLTGNPSVDDLLLTYDLTLEAYHPWSFGHAAILRSSRPLNIAALAKLFEPIEGVTYADPDGVMGDGNDIDIGNNAFAWCLSYSLGWGDCPSGCIERRYWSFSVGRDGHVTYEGSYGSPLPAVRY